MADAVKCECGRAAEAQIKCAWAGRTGPVAGRTDGPGPECKGPVVGTPVDERGAPLVPDAPRFLCLRHALWWSAVEALKEARARLRELDANAPAELLEDRCCPTHDLCDVMTRVLRLEVALESPAAGGTH